METLIDNDLISVISNDSFESLDDLDDNENTMIIGGIEINKKEYLKTLHILQNIHNKKKEEENKVKIIEQIQDYENKLMSLYVELQLYDNIETFINSKCIRDYSCRYSSYPSCCAYRKCLINDLTYIKKYLILSRDNNFNKIKIEINNIKNKIQILILKYNNFINNNYEIIKNKSKLYTIYEVSQNNKEIFDNLNNYCRSQIYNTIIYILLNIFKEMIDDMKIQYPHISFENEGLKIIERECENLEKILLNNNYEQVFNTEYNFIGLDKIICDGIKYNYKDLLEIYESIVKENDNKLLIEELNNYKEQNKLLINELKEIKDKLLRKNIDLSSYDKLKD